MRIKILILNLCFVFSLSASTSSDAEKAYRAEEWAKAEQLYAQLLKASPSNRIYHHRYGVSLLEQNKDLAQAEKHLLRAKNSGVRLSLYYLGRVCFLQYKFDESMAYYKAFLAQSSNQEYKALAQAHLLKSEQGKLLLSRTEQVQILDRIEVDRADFFTHYQLGKETGSFLQEASLIGEDSLAENSTIYMTERGDRAFFSLTEASGHTDLYAKSKLLNRWSEKTPLGESVNSEDDEAFPFLMSDGVVLYFSSKGHNSLGGYDIYVTRYNASNNSYLPPQQLGMPFNSPGDDLLFVIDEYNNVGWFASDRDSEEGKIAIYTFVPNEYFTLLETDDKEALIKAAKATFSHEDESVDSIAEESTTTEVKSERNTESTAQPSTHKIYFVLNDTLIYSSLQDFMSEDARRQYLNYEQFSAAYDSVSQAVADKRLAYSRVSDSDTKAKMIAEIMSLEDRSFSIEEKRDESLRASRRLELETIIANGGYVKAKPEVVPAPEPEIRPEVDYRSAWENELPKVQEEVVDKPFFYNKTLYSYYEQIYSEMAVQKLVEAHQMKNKAADKQFLADYVMREYNKPEPEATFFQKIFAYDTTLTPQLSQNEMIAKVTKISDEGALLFVKANYLNYYTLKGQNVILLESVTDQQYREEIQGLIRRADFCLQTADQNIYVREGVYSNDNQKLSAGNNDLKEGIQLQEAASLSYLKYRYEQQHPRANKPQVEGISHHDETEHRSSDTDLTPRQTIEEKTITKAEELPQERVEYRIQFGIFSRLLKESDVKLKDLSYSPIEDKALYRYFSGHYTTPMDAALALEEVKAKGFKDAYVVKFVNGVLQK